MRPIVDYFASAVKYYTRGSFDRIGLLGDFTNLRSFLVIFQKQLKNEYGWKWVKSTVKNIQTHSYEILNSSECAVTLINEYTKFLKENRMKISNKDKVFFEILRKTNMHILNAYKDVNKDSKELYEKSNKETRHSKEIILLHSINNLKNNQFNIRLLQYISRSKPKNFNNLQHYRHFVAHEDLILKDGRLSNERRM